MDREGPLPLSGLGEFEVQASNRWLPVARVMKTAIPQQAKITKEAKGFMQECVS